VKKHAAGKTGALLVAALVLIALSMTACDSPASGQTRGHLVSSGERRSYLLYVPESYDPAQPTPLVLVFHGFAGWPGNQARVSQWNELADAEGFIVVYPSGTSFPKRWRTSGVSAQGKDAFIDVQFVSDLIDRLEAQYNIDPARIYASGISNGGGMSYLLACTLSDRIAAVGSVAGAYIYPMSDCLPTRPVPMMVFHGDADQIVPYLGGPSRSFDLPFPSIPQWVQMYAAFNKCQATPQQIDGLAVDVSGVYYGDCAANAEVVFYTIAGGGHSWPGGNPLPVWITGQTSQGIDATRTIWQFFQRHPLAGE
jgi:polyhydroxybutyrate depolymerase